MRVRELGTTACPHIHPRDFFAGGAGARPLISVQRREIPYWQERGWVRDGNRLHGIVSNALRVHFMAGSRKSDPATLNSFFTTHLQKSGTTAIGFASRRAATSGIWSTWRGDRRT